MPQLRTAEHPHAVLIIGGRGEFGQFLRSDILPRLAVRTVLTIERGTPREDHAERLRQARHVILSTPLAGYSERALELVEQCRNLDQPMTLWLIASVQESVWRAVSAMLATVANPYLAAVFVHPMYGPNGFRAKEREAETFRNILTATVAGSERHLASEVTAISHAFQSKLGISTTLAFSPEQHDQVTAYSQGLSYCVAQLMFDYPAIDELIKEQMPDLHHSFHANHKLIKDFIQLNGRMSEVTKVFTQSWQRTRQAAYEDVLRAFAEVDSFLHQGVASAIPTKWYEKLRAAASTLT